MARVVSVVHVVGIVAIAGLLGSATRGWAQSEATELLRCRSSVQELSDLIRTMRWRAVAQRRMFELHIDEARGSFQSVAIEGKLSVERVEQTVWLSDGLQVIEAPDRLSLNGAGPLSRTSIVISAPRCYRLFRLTVTEDGFVQLREELLL